MSSVIIELTAICKTFAEKVASKSTAEMIAQGGRRTGMEPISPHINDCLLFQLTRCFRKRLFKMWEKIIESDRLTISYQSIQQTSDSHVLSTSLQSEHEMELDVHAPYMKYIEPLAFRVPAPITSAGVFNSRGQLVCFGNARVCLEEVINGAQQDSSFYQHAAVSSNIGNSGTGKHKSYANTLVTKIINTSAGADQSGEGRGLQASNSIEFEQGGVLHTHGIEISDPSLAAKAGVVGRMSPGLSPGVSGAAGATTLPETSKKASGAAQPKSSPAHQAEAGGRSHSRRSRTSSMESDFSDGSPRPGGSGDEEEDYQFTFDPDTKEAETETAAVLVRVTDSSTLAPSPHGSGNSTEETGMAEEKVCAFSEPLHMLDILVENTPLGSVNKRNTGLLSLGSQQSVFDAEYPSDVPKKTIANQHMLQVYTALYATEMRLLHAYSVGPLSRHADGVSATPITPVAQAVANQLVHYPPIVAPVVSSKGGGRGNPRSPPPTPVAVQRTLRAVPPLTQEEALERAQACRQNALSVQQLCPADRGLSQFWDLLAVVLDMLTITDSGCLIGWNHCTIGLALLHRLYKYMREINDLQTFATAICIMGGSDILVDLLQPYYSKQHDESSQESKGESSSALVSNKHVEKKVTSFDSRRVRKELESVLYAYNDVLHRWGEQMSAVEVMLLCLRHLRNMSGKFGA